MSISHLQRIRLGVFMVAGCVLILIFVIIGIGSKLTDKTKRYYTHFSGESLSGLEVGSSVKFHGVSIGRVEKISFDSADIARIRVALEINNDFPVKEDMIVQTGMVGITGLLYLEIMGGSTGAKTLRENAELRSKKSIIQTITGKAEVIITKVELLLNHLNLLTHPDSLASIKKILDNVQDITATAKSFVDEFSPDVKSIAASTRQTMNKVDSITTNIQSITGKVDREIDLGQFARIMNQVDSTARAMKELSESLTMTVKQSREDITVSMENLRETLENANELSKILVENPSLILKGESQQERTIK